LTEIVKNDSNVFVDETKIKTK